MAKDVEEVSMAVHRIGTKQDIKTWPDVSSVNYLDLIRLKHSIALSTSAFLHSIQNTYNFVANCLFLTPRKITPFSFTFRKDAAGRRISNRAVHPTAS